MISSSPENEEILEHQPRSESSRKALASSTPQAVRSPSHGTRNSIEINGGFD